MAAFYQESDYENALLELFEQHLGYEYVCGYHIDHNVKSSLYDEVLEESIFRINKGKPYDAIKNALLTLKNFENGTLVQKNAVFTDYLQNGISARYTENGEERSTLIYLIDWENIENNSFICANQWTFIENSNRRPDILLFINGLPLVLVELKSPSREDTDASEGYTQIRNYMHEIPSMFYYNQICVMSDQLTSKAGTITSDETRFMEWKTVDGSYENTEYAQFDTFLREYSKKKDFLIF